MAVSSQYVKNLKIRPKSGNSVVLMEGDKIDFNYLNDDEKSVHVAGELIKIGVKGTRYYIVVLDYMYMSEDNVHFTYVENILKVNNIERSREHHSFSPVYCADESVLLLKQQGGVLRISDDGKIWRSITSGDGSGGGGSDGLFIAMQDLGYDGTVEELAATLKSLVDKSVALNVLADNEDDIIAMDIREES